MPTAFALNRTPEVNYLEQYRSAATAAATVLEAYETPGLTAADPRETVGVAVRTRTWTDETTSALHDFILATNSTIQPYGSAAELPDALVGSP